MQSAAGVLTEDQGSRSPAQGLRDKVESPGSRVQSLLLKIRDAGGLWAWTSLLLLVNLPLVSGGVRAGLIFLPEAVAHGQWWRILTHPLVHLSWYHLLLDAAGFLLLFAGLEEKRPGVKALYLAGTGAGSLLLALLLDPAIFRQGLCGLSGIAHGLMAISALEMIRARDLRTWGFISMAAVTVKSAYELFTGHVVFEFMHMGLCGRPLAASHAGGVVGGVVMFAMVFWGKGSREDSSPGARNDCLKK